MEKDENLRWGQFEDRKTRWYVFINYSFILWRGDTRKTVAEMAREIGVSQGLLTQWMQRGGRVPRSQESINKLVKYFGDVIYEVLLLPKPGDSIDTLPEPLRTISHRVKASFEEQNISPESPEGAKLIDEIMKEFGYRLN